MRSQSVFLAIKSRQDRDRDAQMVPNDLARQAASEDLHIDLPGSWPVLELIWPDLGSNFEIDLSMSKSFYFETARRGEHDDAICIFDSLISKKLLIKNIAVKNNNFKVDDL